MYACALNLPFNWLEPVLFGRSERSNGKRPKFVFFTAFSFHSMKKSFIPYKILYMTLIGSRVPRTESILIGTKSTLVLGLGSL